MPQWYAISSTTIIAGNNFYEIILYEWRGGENVCCWEKSSFHLPLGQGQGTSLFWLTLGPRPGTCLLCICFLPPRFLRWWWGCVYAANDENVYAAVPPHNSPPQLELLSQTQTPDREERKDMDTIICPYLYHWVCAWFFFLFVFSFEWILSLIAQNFG